MKIIKTDRKTFALEIKNGELVVHAPLSATGRQIDDLLLKHKRWIENHLQKHAEQTNTKKLTQDELHQLAKQMIAVLPSKLHFWAERIGVTYGKVTVRNQTSKWGSCTSNGNLNFNVLLMLAPEKVLDSVIVHELCHRKEMNHSERFYREVYRVFPDYDQWNKWLKDNGSALMAQNPNA